MADRDRPAAPASRRERPAVYTIPAHRAFADALAAGVMAQHGRDPMALARGIILLPNNRSVRAVTDAFVRRSQGGLLMPRLVPIGDLELDETLGNALDPIGTGAEVPPAIGTMERHMILARLVQEERARLGRSIDAGEAMRLAQDLGRTLDHMLVEDVAPSALREIDLSAELSEHWNASLQLLELVLDRWPRELAERGRIDVADRRNRLLRHIARRWGETPPPGFVVAAGISTTAPAICGLLRAVSRMKRGQVVLAELDQAMEQEDWDAIGPFEADPVTGRAPPAHESHPQYALKRLLDHIGVARDEVALWRWGGGHDARAARSRTISHAMLVPGRTAKWREVPSGERTLAGVSAIEAATPAEEAQAIALVLREVLETPERTAALVTPDRTLAQRVTAHLRRWGVTADDSAGQPLSHLPPGTLLLALVRVVAERFAPVALLNLLKHPLVRRGDARIGWLEAVRDLDLLLRGPRPGPDLAGIDALLEPRPADARDRQAPLRARVAVWWRDEARPLLEPLQGLGHEGLSFGPVLATLRDVAGQLCGDAVWAGHQGRAASDFIAEVEEAAPLGPARVSVRALPDMLERLLACVAVRPPQGGHPRIAIYGLIEARLQQADLMILAGLNEGTWPALPAPDPWLAPRIRAELGLPGLDRRIGMAAHDFASGLGAPHVVISRARRSGSAPAVASRFWLRLRAMAGQNFDKALADGARWVALARAIDEAGKPEPVDRPAPCPSLALRPRKLSVTEVDRLRADPFAFYARRVLRLGALERIDADPGPAWRGTNVHRALELWFREDKANPALLEQRGRDVLAQGNAHPLLRALWQPRLLAAFRWIASAVAADAAEGRHITLVEASGRVDIAGVTLTGQADRIDRCADGSLAIVDYKTGKPPSGKQVKAGYALQLGLLGLIAEQGSFDGLTGGATASTFEYWSLSRGKDDAFGYRKSPCSDGAKAHQMASDTMVAHAAANFTDAADRWLTGMEPFTATINPDLPHYTEFDHLMRLQEWFGREQRRAEPGLEGRTDG